MPAASRKPDLILVFSPLYVQVTHPELGMPQLTANLQREGYSVEQHDLNIEFQYRYMRRLDVVERLLAEIAPHVDPATSETFPWYEVLGRAMLESCVASSRPPIEGNIASWVNRCSATHNILIDVLDRPFDAPASELVGANLPPLMTRIIRAMDRPGYWKTLVELIDWVYFQPASFDVDDVLAAVQDGVPLLDRYFDEFLDGVFDRAAPRAFGLSIASTRQLVPTLILARMIKERTDVPILAGGPWCTAAQSLLAGLEPLSRYLDIVVLFEGETALLDIMRRLVEGTPIEDSPMVLVPGVHAAEQTPPLALDEMAMPVYDGLPMELYHTRGVSLRLTRGCHWARCNFCHHVFPGYTARYATRGASLPDRYLDKVLDHVRFIVEEHGCRHFFISDNGPPTTIMKQFADGLLARQMRVTWQSLARFDDDLPKVAPVLASSGCKALFFGLETCNTSELERFSKGIDPDMADRCLHACREARIANLVFIMNYPFLPRESFAATLSWLARRADLVDQVIAFRFGLARYSRSFGSVHDLGMRTTVDPDRYMEVVYVPYEIENGVTVDEFIEDMERFEASLPRGPAVLDDRERIRVRTPMPPVWGRFRPPASLPPTSGKT